MFKKMRGIRLPYIKQGIIYFTCRDYIDQPRDVQQKINNLCMTVAGDRYQLLRDIMIKGKPIRLVAIDSEIEGINPACERTLYTLRKRFYERW